MLQPSLPSNFITQGHCAAFHMNKQRNNILVLLVAFLSVGLCVNQVAHAQIGFSAGYNYNKLTDIDLGGGNSSFENATGWHAELWFDLPIGGLALRPGLRYMSAGKIFEFANDSDPNFRDNFNISLFEIPIDFRFRFNMEVITPFISIGPVLRFPSGSKDDISGMQNVSVAGGFGFGIELDFGLFMVYPEMKYNFGITQFTGEEFQIAGRTFTTADTQLLNGVMLRVGVGL